MTIEEMKARREALCDLREDIWANGTHEALWWLTREINRYNEAIFEPRDKWAAMAERADDDDNRAARIGPES